MKNVCVACDCEFGILRFAKISGLTWRRSIFEKEHIWFVAGGEGKGGKYVGNLNVTNAGETNKQTRENSAT